MANVEHGTQRVIVTVVAGAQVGGVLTVQDVGSLSLELGEVDLVLDEDTELVSILKDSSGVSKRKEIVFNRTPSIHIAGTGSQITPSCQHSMS